MERANELRVEKERHERETEHRETVRGVWRETGADSEKKKERYRDRVNDKHRGRDRDKA
jgi:hypothetical protein